MNQFSKRLKELRGEKGIRQADLASKLDVDQRTISNWEKAVREPDFDMLIRISKLFDVTTDFLLGLDE